MSGTVPVEGVLIESYSCDPIAPQCRRNVTVGTRTSADGTYRLSELYGGDNYIWITKDGYAVVGMPEMPACDNCNRILSLTADTRLDAAVVRR
jgi:hypothetical protein